jgi:hypothetical protein
MAKCREPTCNADGLWLDRERRHCGRSAEHRDRVSCRWQKRRVVLDISLFIADELHLLESEGGPTLVVVLYCNQVTRTMCPQV